MNERDKRLQAGLHTPETLGYRTLEARRSAFLAERGPIGWKKPQETPAHPAQPVGKPLTHPAEWFTHRTGAVRCSECDTAIWPGQARWTRRHPTRPRHSIHRCPTCGRTPD